MNRNIATAAMGCAMLVGLGLSASASAALLGTIGNGSTASTSTLVEINASTGDLVRTIGDVGYLVNGMTYDRNSNTLYATTSDNDENFPAGLIRIDPQTGVGTPIGEGAGRAVNVPASNSAGDLYAWSEWSDDGWDDDLVTLDATTGVATVVGEAALSTYKTGLAFDASNKLYLVNGESGDIYLINTETGLPTYVWSLDGAAHHGDFGPTDNYYYGIDQAWESSEKMLVIVDFDNQTIINTIPTVADLHTLTFHNPPSGGGGAMPLLGLLGLGFLVVLRRRV